VDIEDVGRDRVEYGDIVPAIDLGLSKLVVYEFDLRMLADWWCWAPDWCTVLETAAGLASPGSCSISTYETGNIPFLFPTLPSNQLSSIFRVIVNVSPLLRDSSIGVCAVKLNFALPRPSRVFSFRVKLLVISCVTTVSEGMIST